MKVKLRAILISLFIVMVIVSTTSYLFLRVTESQVVVNKIVKIYEVLPEVLPDSERVIKDKEAVKQFTYAVRFADKQPGVVDFTTPGSTNPFQFTLGNKQYYLWVSEHSRQGTLMKLPNRETVYTIGKSRAKTLLEIMNKEYNMKP